MIYRSISNSKLVQDMKKFIPTLLILFFLSPIVAKSQITIQENLIWENKAIEFKIGNETLERPTFNGAYSPAEFPTLPLYLTDFPVQGYGELDVQVINQEFEAFEKKAGPNDDLLSEQIQFQTEVLRDRNAYVGKLSFIPIIRSGSGFQRLKSFEVQINWRPKAQTSFRGPDNTENSVLETGVIYKIAVTQNGIHKLTYNFLKEDLGMDIDNVDPRRLQLYGNGGGMLPTSIETERIDDLAENRIEIVGEEDGSFDANDYILFYAEGPNKWVYDTTDVEFNLQKNIYDDKNYYFLKEGADNGLRVNDNTQASIAGTAFTSTGFDDHFRLEEDRVNLLHDWVSSQGSGRSWFGDHFKVVREYDYNNTFRFPNLQVGSTAKLKAQMALRAGQSSNFDVIVDGEAFESNTVSKVSQLTGGSANEVEYAKLALLRTTFNLNTATPSVKVRYSFPGGSNDSSEGWLNFIQLNVRRNLTFTGAQLSFRDLETLDYPNSTFNLGNATSGLQIWDITNPLLPKLQETTLSGSTLSFGVETSNLKQFVAFNPNGELLTAEAVGLVENQNVHGIDGVDMVVVYHEAFEVPAQKFAEHRADYSDLNVALVRIDHIFNEFASGRQDPTAVRDFAKMLYERTNNFRYLLLFGDGSFDARNIYELGNNFIPVYQNESMNPIFAFPTDDYYGLLSGSTSSNILSGMLNINIGRFPVKNLTEAEGVVNKIINYDNNPVTFKDWRNRLLFVGDDEDGSVHTKQADGIARMVDNDYTNFNIDKVYLDAFPQISTPGGQRFPSANEAINNSIFKGILAITYLGHGGSKGWAQERVLNISDILSWENIDKQPLFLTATCSFTGYDDAGFTTAGEEVFLNEKGGAIALLTTVRAVYSSQNAELTEETIQRLLERPNGIIPTLGEVITNAKNSFVSGSIVTNSRKFALIGDPAQKLAIPQYTVATTRIDQQDVSESTSDTLRALQKVTIEGAVLGADSTLNESFNGQIFPTVFDKKITVSTIGQDQGSTVVDFTLQKNVIFKGRASVQNGRFSFSFVVPKDINYQFGQGKISYYAADVDQMVDAAGSYENIIIGGTDPNALQDDQGPIVEVFMNTEDFVFGGITDANPTLLVKLSDDNGINVVGNSIGHDLEGVLDQNTQNTLLLNDFYESELDDYTKGEVRFPLNDLEEGRHEIRVKAWDVANNSAEGYTEFVVALNAEVALEHVLNYPNPFTDFTCFQFDHNLTNQDVDILVQIYTVSGRLVKTIEQSIFTDGAIRLDNCIEWDGRDDYGDVLGRGIYLYKIKVRATATGDQELSGESDFEKLVILK